MAMRAPDLRTVTAALQAYAGTVVGLRRAEIIEARLHQMARARGLTTVEPLVEALRDPGSALSSEVMDGLVNCETSFFRDSRAFDSLRDFVIPEVMARRASVRRLRILCAGCATGQEPYSVAMLIREKFPTLARWQVEICGLDVSLKRTERAAAGLFSRHEVERGLTQELVRKYFQPEGDKLRISASLRAFTQFRRLNLMERWPAVFGYDIVLLRNVLIYLDDAAKSCMLSEARRSLHAHGLLMLGAAERIPPTNNDFDRAAWSHYPVYTPRKAGS
jgi:chemotaxis protein methyltransferase CheR